MSSSHGEPFHASGGRRQILDFRDSHSRSHGCGVATRWVASAQGMTELLPIQHAWHELLGRRNRTEWHGRFDRSRTNEPGGCVLENARPTPDSTNKRGDHAHPAPPPPLHRAAHCTIRQLPPLHGSGALDKRERSNRHRLRQSG